MNVLAKSDQIRPDQQHGVSFWFRNRLTSTYTSPSPIEKLVVTLNRKYRAMSVNQNQIWIDPVSRIHCAITIAESMKSYEIPFQMN